jgi:uncharacterized protein
MNTLDPPKRVAVTGARGFLGSAVAQALTAEGSSIHSLVRRTAGAGEIRWDPQSGYIESEKLEGVDAVIHLAGENIAAVWTPAKKQRIMQSRQRGTRLLAESLARLRQPPRILVSASAVGYYGDAGDAELTEGSPAGDDFLARVCVAWEAAVRPAEDAGIRVVRTRFGLLLHPEGSVLELALPVFRLGLGARFGGGRQWLSWIWRDDAVRAILFALETAEMQGPVNVVAPVPVRNEEFTRTLARAVHRPAILAVPAFALRTLTGGMADALLLASQRVVPAELSRHGFEFHYPRLGDALAAGLD